MLAGSSGHSGEIRLTKPPAPNLPLILAENIWGNAWKWKLYRLLSEFPGYASFLVPTFAAKHQLQG
jgi:hypothetical protein